MIVHLGVPLRGCAFVRKGHEADENALAAEDDDVTDGPSASCRDDKNSMNTTDDKIDVDDILEWAEENIHLHRGAIPLGNEMSAIFGNDGYPADKRVQREVELVREALRELEEELGEPGEEISFGSAENGTWVMVVSVHWRDASAMVWDAWFAACGIERPKCG